MPEHTPSRRGLLAAVAAVAAGGCLDRVATPATETPGDTRRPQSDTESADADPTARSPTDETPTARAVSVTPTHADVGPDWPTPTAGATAGYASDPVATVAVGSDDARPPDVEPHEVVIRNATDAERRVETRVWLNGESVVDRTDALPAAGELLVDLREPGRYVIAVRADRDDRGVVVSNREREWFDCNESATTVAVRQTGYARGFITTSLACATP
ncbi:hypothetical protein RYH80_06265 [Halobaculum sp. MBLA0147]|uniref:hypothetical protein n=1 Tax=Halobaculum sp. MBLA0147 TaxID=3079934 RepID=UPI00352417D6